MPELKTDFKRKTWKDCCGKGCKKCEIAQAYTGEFGRKEGLEKLNADRKLVLAIYKRMPVGNKMLRGGKHTIMLSGPSAPAYGVDNYTNLVLEDLSHADLVRAADAVGARLPAGTARSVGRRTVTSPVSEANTKAAAAKVRSAAAAK